LKKKLNNMKKEIHCENDLLKWYIKTRIQESTKGSDQNIFKTPLALSFLLTNRCVLKCKHCFYHKTMELDKKKELTFNEYSKISEKLSSFIYAFFCGGEPFLRDDFSEIVSLFQINNNVIWSNSTTNGQLINKIINSVQRLVENNNRFFNLNFSFEGPEEINDVIRGKGAFKKALESFKECAKIRDYNKNLKLGITTTMCSLNQNYLMDFFSWAHETLKPDQINCLMIRQDPRGGEALKDVDINNYLEVSNLLKKIRADINPNTKNLFYHQLSIMNDIVYQTHIKNEKQFVCYAGSHGGFIDYDGSVNVCEVFCDKTLNPNSNSLTLGNLKDYEYDFIKLWNSPKANTIRKEVNVNQICSKCTHETEGLIPSLLIEPNALAHYVNEI